MGDQGTNAGCMVAFMLPDDIAQQLNAIASNAGLDAQHTDGLHITLAYLGQAADLPKDQLLEAVRTFAASSQPVTGSINGVGRFFTTQDDNSHAMYANFDAADLPEFRQRLIDTLSSVGGVEAQAEHGFTPHITLAYIDADDDTPDIAFEPMNISFNAISLVFGDERMDEDLNGTTQTDNSKAILIPVSDDLDPFEIGDTVVFESWDISGPMTSGSSFIGVIRAINGLDATIEYYTPDMQPSGGTCVRPLMALREYIIPGISPDADSTAKADKPAAKSSVREANTAIKAISDDGWRVGGYLVLYGSIDQPDLQGEHFTKSTDFGLDWFQRRPMLFEHGQYKGVGSNLMGAIDTLEPDDLGVWAEGVLDRRQKYAQKVKELVAKGALGWSSGSMSHLVRKMKSGEITKWPICEASMTATPAEPRTLAVPTKHYIADGESDSVLTPAFKSLGISTDRLEPQDAAEIARSNKDGNAATKAVSDTRKQSTTVKATKMDGITKEDLAAIIAAALKENQGVAPATNAENSSASIKNSADDLKAEIRQLFATAFEEQKPRRQLPNPQVEPEKPAAKTNVQVIGDVRYASLSSEDLSFLVSVYSGIAHGSRNKQGPLDPLESEARNFFQKAFNDPNRAIQREISAKAIREHARNQVSDAVLTYLPYKSLDAVYANDYDDAPVKAAIKSNELDNTAQTGFGLEWVPTIWNANLWRRVRISNPFAGTMQMIEMPSNPYNLPIESTDPTVVYVAEGTDATQLVLGSGNTITLSKIGSDKRQLTAKKLGTRIGFSTELVEDSIIPILPYYRAQAQRVLQNYVDDTIVNGDIVTTASTNINDIDGTPAAGTSYLALDGLRKYALVTNTAQALDNGGGSPTLAQFRNLRKTLSKPYAADLPNLVYVVAFEVYMRMLSLPEFASWQTLGVPGSNVTGLLPNGSPDQVSDVARPVGLIDGIPVYISAQIGLAQSSGKISATPSNNTLGSAVLFHRTRWFVGYRRHIDLQTVPTGMFSDTYQLWATVRFALQSFDTVSSSTLYDIAV